MVELRRNTTSPREFTHAPCDELEPIRNDGVATYNSCRYLFLLFCQSFCCIAFASRPTFRFLGLAHDRITPFGHRGIKCLFRMNIARSLQGNKDNADSKGLFRDERHRTFPNTRSAGGATILAQGAVSVSAIEGFCFSSSSTAVAAHCECGRLWDLQKCM
jgi:hypothetical protein